MSVINGVTLTLLPVLHSIISGLHQLFPVLFDDCILKANRLVI